MTRPAAVARVCAKVSFPTCNASCNAFCSTKGRSSAPHVQTDGSWLAVASSLMGDGMAETKPEGKDPNVSA